MRRLMLIAAVAGALPACTLLLPTEELITACTVDEDCGEGLSCEDNACLPIDDAAAGEGEGE